MLLAAQPSEGICAAIPGRGIEGTRAKFSPVVMLIPTPALHPLHSTGAKKLYDACLMVRKTVFKTIAVGVDSVAVGERDQAQF